MRLPVLPLILAALAACTRDKLPETYVPPERPNDSCNSAAYREFIGQPASVLNDLVIPDPKRILPEGAPMTEDYSPVRVNFDIDGAGNIGRVWCG